MSFSLDRTGSASIVLKKPSFHLIAVYGPFGIWLFFTTIEFQIRSGTDLFDQAAKQKRLSTVSGAACRLPAANFVAPEGQVSPNTKQQILVRNPPVVAHTELWLDPNETRLVFEAPVVHHIECLSKKRIRCPKMQVGILCRNHSYWFIADFLDGHRAIVIFRSTTSSSVGVLPRRVGIDRRKLQPGLHELR